MLSLRAISGAATSSLPGVYAFGLISGTMAAVESATFAIYAGSTEFITRASDTPANQPFLGTFMRPGTITRSLSGSGFYGAISVGYGEPVLVNAEADYDDLVENYSVDGQRVVIKVGTRTDRRNVGPYANFAIVADLQATGWMATEDELRISVRDKSYLLEAPAQPNAYLGTGGMEGTAELTGKRKPIACGPCSNASPEFVIPTELVYQAHDGAATSIGAVYDRGAALTATADYATSLLLRAATLVPGQYGTCLAEGCFRLGGAPDGQVTCDVTMTPPDGSTIAGVVRFLIENACDVTDADFDDATFDLMDVLQSATISYYLPSGGSETVAQAGARIVGPSGWFGSTRIGLFEIRRFDAPSTAAVARYEEFDFVDFDKVKLPGDIDPIVRRIRVTYDINNTVQTGADLVGDITENDPARAAYLAQPFRAASTSEASASAILNNYPLAKDLEPIELFFTTAAAAQAEANRLFAIYGVDRAAYRFIVKGMTFMQEVGDTIHVTHPRWGLDTGKYLVVVECEDDIDNDETVIVAFG